MLGKYQKLIKTIEYMIKRAGSGHYASSMSALEIMYPLFYEESIKPDQFILSKGHAAPALYAILFDLGYLKQKDIDKFRQHDGLPGHPELSVNGVLAASGSLGMGISKTIGLAYANPNKVYHVLIGDGELQEGQNFEALLYISSNEMTNIKIHIDANAHQYSNLIPENIDIRLCYCSPIPECVDNDILIVHETTWDHDNSYLCKPKQRDDTYFGTLRAAMIKNPSIVVLNADLEQDFNLTKIKQDFPDRYIQSGISEQHMVSMANGFALAGKIPICHTFGAFYRRAIDQMYNNQCDGLHIGYVAGLIEHGETNIGMSHRTINMDIIKSLGIDIVYTMGEFFELLDKKKGVYFELK